MKKMYKMIRQMLIREALEFKILSFIILYFFNNLIYPNSNPNRLGKQAKKLPVGNFSAQHIALKDNHVRHRTCGHPIGLLYTIVGL